MRSVCWPVLLLLAVGCGHAAPERPNQPASKASELAAPITAPMAARDRLLHDLEHQQRLARARSALLDDTVPRDR